MMNLAWIVGLNRHLFRCRFQSWFDGIYLRLSRWCKSGRAGSVAAWPGSNNSDKCSIGDLFIHFNWIELNRTLSVSSDFTPPLHLSTPLLFPLPPSALFNWVENLSTGMRNNNANIWCHLSRFPDLFTTAIRLIHSSSIANKSRVRFINPFIDPTGLCHRIPFKTNSRNWLEFIRSYSIQLIWSS